MLTNSNIWLHVPILKPKQTGIENLCEDAMLVLCEMLSLKQVDVRSKDRSGLNPFARQLFLYMIHEKYVKTKAYVKYGHTESNFWNKVCKFINLDRTTKFHAIKAINNDLVFKNTGTSLQIRTILEIYL